MQDVGKPGLRSEARPEFYQHVAHGYDLTAPYYDEVEGRNAISERVRRFSLAAALDSFRAGDRVVELGCGTGRDAVFLARHGIFVHATDVSPEMVARTRARAERERVESFVTTQVCSAAGAASTGGPYDGAYSNGAVLNLEPDLERVAAGLSRTLRPGARAQLSVANRLSLFELFLYSVILRPRKAFRKLGSSVPIPVSRGGSGKRYVVATRFFTPREFSRMFAGAFDVVGYRGLQIFTPPWNLVDMADRFRTVVNPLEEIEDRVGQVPGLRSLGAIYLLSLRRKGR